MTADSMPNRAPVNWPALIMFVLTTIPVVTVLPWYWVKFGFDGFEWACFFVLWALNGMSITAGYHRLWAHRSYEASKPLQIFYMLFGAMALQNSILVWASSHRVHHRHVDDVDQDPYSAKRGLWFSHMGWMLRNYESGKQDFRNAKDLEANPIVAFQHKHYVLIATAMNLGLPLLLGWMNGNIWGSLLLGGFLRLVVSHHCTFFINSLAHFWGSRPYTTENTARDNGVLALFTWGEGYHNYHHLFQWDYRNGIRWYQWDPTKWLICAAKFVGLARSLKRVPEFQIRQALVERQLQEAEENLGQCQDHGRLAALRQSLETEMAHFKETLAHWAMLQQKKVEAAKKAVIDHIEHTELAQRVRELEESLRQQYLRVRLIAVQAT
ncbi:acyl-CoA desaturase [Peristeroidobacter soli]|jgi:stearoyl-CoA desaturase (delta-9 desaturase)|uniref:acyl-CoA desaturase n=1 Tax=Peristeroidobacter soli TaxID=2497877 RepID=UPI00101D2263|nr:fatty acid desaturase [Peristeroidobacter soli]